MNIPLPPPLNPDFVDLVLVPTLLHEVRTSQLGQLIPSDPAEEFPFQDTVDTKYSVVKVKELNFEALDDVEQFQQRNFRIHGKAALSYFYKEIHKPVAGPRLCVIRQISFEAKLRTTNAISIFQSLKIAFENPFMVNALLTSVPRL